MKILIVIDNLNTGGVATSFYNFLDEMHSNAEYDILVFNENSINKSRLPCNVKILPTQKVLHVLGKTHVEISSESKLLMLLRMVLKILATTINGVFARSLLMPFIHNVGHYDLAIAYSQDDAWKNLSKGCIDLIIRKCHAKCKSVVIHCDYKTFGGYHPAQKGQYDRLNNIICVSESCKKSFCECYPSLQKKTIVCENFTNSKDILRKASMPSESIPVEYISGEVRFVTVCRVSPEKGLQRTIEAFYEAESEGYSNYRWIIVGDGPEKKNLENLIKLKGMEKRVILVGNKSNPYPYIKMASFFLLPSENEAAPMVFGESAVLEVPIITTNTCSAIELVEKRGLGWVVENSKDGIKKGVINAMKGDYHDINIKRINDINKKAHSQFDTFYKSIDC